jgi:hypothetical protein
MIIAQQSMVPWKITIGHLVGDLRLKVNEALSPVSLSMLRVLSPVSLSMVVSKSPVRLSKANFKPDLIYFNWRDLFFTVLIFIKAFSFGIVIINSCTYTGQVNWTFGRWLYFTLDILTGDRTLYPDKLMGDEAILLSFSGHPQFVQGFSFSKGWQHLESAPTEGFPGSN